MEKDTKPAPAEEMDLMCHPELLYSNGQEQLIGDVFVTKERIKGHRTR